MAVALPTDRVVRPGDLLCVTGQGLPTVRGGQGDLYVEAQVVFPETLDAGAKEKVRPRGVRRGTLGCLPETRFKAQRVRRTE